MGVTSRTALDRSIRVGVGIAAGCVLLAASCSGEPSSTVSSGSAEPSPAAIATPTPTLPAVTVYPRDAEDDVPDPRHIRQDACESGIALQAQPVGMMETDFVGEETEWQAIVVNLGAVGRDASPSLSSSIAHNLGSLHGNLWTVVSNEGEVLAVAQTIESTLGGHWTIAYPEFCTKVS